MNIIDDRNVRTIHRKLKKKEYDDIIKLSVSETGQTVRLLDEGTVVDALGKPLFYIMKGTLEKYMNAIPEGYEGSINLGHMDFATFPFLLGRWTKEDLFLVDIGDGRKALNVRLRLDDENVFVRELRRAEYDLGVSAEFGFHENTEKTEQYGIQMIDEVFIRDFAIVGEAGNVNSSNIELKGGAEVAKTVDLKALSAAIAKEDGKVTDLAALNKALGAIVEPEEEISEDTPEETPEETSEETTEETSEETAEETVEEEAHEEVEVPEETEDEPVPEIETEETKQVSLSAVMAIVDDMRAELKTLREDRDKAIAARDKAVAELSAKEEEEKQFIEKMKKLVVVTREETKPVSAPHIGMTNGMGEL